MWESSVGGISVLLDTMKWESARKDCIVNGVMALYRNLFMNAPSCLEATQHLATSL